MPSLLSPSPCLPPPPPTSAEHLLCEGQPGGRAEQTGLCSQGCSFLGRHSCGTRRVKCIITTIAIIFPATKDISVGEGEGGTRLVLYPPASVSSSWEATLFSPLPGSKAPWEYPRCRPGLKSVSQPHNYRHLGLHNSFFFKESPIINLFIVLWSKEPTLPE